MLSRPEPFIRELQQALPERPFTVRLWDGVDAARHERRRAHLRGALAGRPRARDAVAGPARALRAPTCRARSTWTTSTPCSRCSRTGSRRRSSGVSRRGSRSRRRARSACGARRMCRASELRLQRPPPHAASATRAPCATTTTCPNEFFALFLGEAHDLQLRDLLARREDARGGAGDEARAGLHEARPEGGPARARHRLRLGQLRHPRRRAPRRVRWSASRSPSRRPSSRASAWRERGLSDRVEIRVQDYRDTRRRAVRRGVEHRHGRARGRRTRSTCTRASSRGS